MFSECGIDPSFADKALPAFATVIGAYVSYLAITGNAKRQEQREADGVRSAIYSEVRSVLSLFMGHRYVAELKNARQGMLPGGDKRVIVVPAHGEYTKIFDANLDKIGLLGEQAAAVVAFYSLFESLLEDAREHEAFAKPLVGASTLTMGQMKSLKINYENLATKITILQDEAEAIAKLIPGLQKDPSLTEVFHVAKRYLATLFQRAYRRS